MRKKEQLYCTSFCCICILWSAEHGQSKIRNESVFHCSNKREWTNIYLWFALVFVCTFVDYSWTFHVSLSSRTKQIYGVWKSVDIGNKSNTSNEHLCIVISNQIKGSKKTNSLTLRWLIQLGQKMEINIWVCCRYAQRLSQQLVAKFSHSLHFEFWFYFLRARQFCACMHVWPIQMNWTPTEWWTMAIMQAQPCLLCV